MIHVVRLHEEISLVYVFLEFLRLQQATTAATTMKAGTLMVQYRVDNVVTGKLNTCIMHTMGFANVRPSRPLSAHLIVQKVYAIHDSRKRHMIVTV